jgi:hypothetical protein
LRAIVPKAYQFLPLAQCNLLLSIAAFVAVILPRPSALATQRQLIGLRTNAYGIQFLSQ